MKSCGKWAAFCVCLLLIAGCVSQEEKERRNAIKSVLDLYDKDCVRGFGGLSLWAEPFESGYLVSIEDYTQDDSCQSALVYWLSDREDPAIYAVSDAAKRCSPEMPTVFDEATTKKALALICSEDFE